MKKNEITIAITELKNIPTYKTTVAVFSVIRNDKVIAEGKYDRESYVGWEEAGEDGDRTRPEVKYTSGADLVEFIKEDTPLDDMVMEAGNKYLKELDAVILERQVAARKESWATLPIRDVVQFINDNLNGVNAGICATEEGYLDVNNTNHHGIDRKIGAIATEAYTDSKGNDHELNVRIEVREKCIGGNSWSRHNSGSIAYTFEINNDRQSRPSKASSVAKNVASALDIAKRKIEIKIEDTAKANEDKEGMNNLFPSFTRTEETKYSQHGSYSNRRSWKVVTYENSETNEVITKSNTKGMFHYTIGRALSVKEIEAVRKVLGNA